MKEILKEILIQNQERKLTKGLRARNTGISLDLEKIQATVQTIKKLFLPHSSAITRT